MPGVSRGIYGRVSQSDGRVTTIYVLPLVQDVPKHSDNIGGALMTDTQMKASSEVVEPARKKDWRAGQTADSARIMTEVRTGPQAARITKKDDLPFLEHARAYCEGAVFVRAQLPV